MQAAAFAIALWGVLCAAGVSLHGSLRVEVNKAKGNVPETYSAVLILRVRELNIGVADSPVNRDSSRDTAIVSRKSSERHSVTFPLPTGASVSSAYAYRARVADIEEQVSVDLEDHDQAPAAQAPLYTPLGFSVQDDMVSIHVSALRRLEHASSVIRVRLFGNVQIIPGKPSRRSNRLLRNALVWRHEASPGCFVRGSTSDWLHRLRVTSKDTPDVQETDESPFNTLDLAVLHPIEETMISASPVTRTGSGHARVVFLNRYVNSSATLSPMDRRGFSWMLVPSSGKQTFDVESIRLTVFGPPTPAHEQDPLLAANFAAEVLSTTNALLSAHMLVPLGAVAFDVRTLLPPGIIATESLKGHAISEACARHSLEQRAQLVIYRDELSVVDSWLLDAYAIYHAEVLAFDHDQHVVMREALSRDAMHRKPGSLCSSRSPDRYAAVKGYLALRLLLAETQGEDVRPLDISSAPLNFADLVKSRTHGRDTDAHLWVTQSNYPALVVDVLRDADGTPRLELHQWQFPRRTNARNLWPIRVTLADMFEDESLVRTVMTKAHLSLRLDALSNSSGRDFISPLKKTPLLRRRSVSPSLPVADEHVETVNEALKLPSVLPAKEKGPRKWHFGGVPVQPLNDTPVIPSANLKDLTPRHDPFTRVSRPPPKSKIDLKMTLPLSRKQSAQLDKASAEYAAHRVSQYASEHWEAAGSHETARRPPERMDRDEEELVHGRGTEWRTRLRLINEGYSDGFYRVLYTPRAVASGLFDLGGSPRSSTQVFDDAVEASAARSLPLTETLPTIAAVVLASKLDGIDSASEEALWETLCDRLSAMLVAFEGDNGPVRMSVQVAVQDVLREKVQRTYGAVAKMPLRNTRAKVFDMADVYRAVQNIDASSKDEHIAEKTAARRVFALLLQMGDAGAVRLAQEMYDDWLDGRHSRGRLNEALAASVRRAALIYGGEREWLEARDLASGWLRPGEGAVRRVLRNCVAEVLHRAWWALANPWAAVAATPATALGVVYFMLELYRDRVAIIAWVIIKLITQVSPGFRSLWDAWGRFTGRVLSRGNVSVACENTLTFEHGIMPFAVLAAVTTVSVLWISLQYIFVDYVVSNWTRIMRERGILKSARESWADNAQAGRADPAMWAYGTVEYTEDEHERLETLPIARASSSDESSSTESSNE